MKKSQLRNIIKESIKELMTEQQGTTCHYFSVCGVPGAPGYSYPWYLNYYTAPNAGDKTIKSNDFYLAIGSPGVGVVTRVQGVQMDNPLLLTCLTYNGTYACTGGMSAYVTSVAQWTQLGVGSPCNSSACARWDCKPQGSHPKFGSKCVQVGPGGQFGTQQDCIASGCEGFRDDSKDTKTQTPFTFDPQSK